MIHRMSIGSLHLIDSTQLLAVDRRELPDLTFDAESQATESSFKKLCLQPPLDHYVPGR